MNTQGGRIIIKVNIRGVSILMVEIGKTLGRNSEKPEKFLWKLGETDFDRVCVWYLDKHLCYAEEFYYSYNLQISVCFLADNHVSGRRLWNARPIFRLHDKFLMRSTRGFWKKPLKQLKIPPQRGVLQTYTYTTRKTPEYDPVFSCIWSSYTYIWK